MFFGDTAFGDTAFGDTASSASGSGGSGSGGSGSASGDSVGTYDPSAGLLVGPSGVLYSAGQGTLAGTGPISLLGLLRQTLGD